MFLNVILLIFAVLHSFLIRDILQTRMFVSEVKEQETETMDPSRHIVTREPNSYVLLMPSVFAMVPEVPRAS